MWLTARLLGSVLAVAAFAGCGGPTSPSDVLAPGGWGGDGIQLTITASGATIDYGCDSGTIDEPLSAGQFVARGTHTFGRGGPIQPGDPPRTPHGARFEGTIQGDSMQLRVLLPALGRAVGDFSLVKGRQPNLERCG